MRKESTKKIAAMRVEPMLKSTQDYFALLLARCAPTSAVCFRQGCKNSGSSEEDKGTGNVVREYQKTHGHQLV